MNSRSNAIKQYISQKDIDLFTHYVYNNLDISELYQDLEPIVNKKGIQNMLLQGEKYALLDEIFPSLIITNYGRFLNGAKCTQYSVGFYKTMTFYKRKQKINVKETFKRFGWHYDIEQIKQRYKDNDWPSYDSKKQYTNQVK